MTTQPGDLRPASDLTPWDELHLLTDSQDLSATLAHLGRSELRAAHLKSAEVTGMIVRVEDADLAEVWATDSSRPFAVGSLYVRVR